MRAQGLRAKGDRPTRPPQPQARRPSIRKKADNPRSLLAFAIVLSTAAVLSAWAVIGMIRQSIDLYGHVHIDLLLISMAVLLGPFAVCTWVVWWRSRAAYRRNMIGPSANRPKFRSHNGQSN